MTRARSCGTFGIEGKSFSFRSPDGPPKKRGSAVDAIDLKILSLLQNDATLSIASIGERVGLSQTPCWKRIQKLQETGVLTGRATLYGVLAGGHPGACKALEILRDELARTMQLCGADTLAAIDETMLRTTSP